MKFRILNLMFLALLVPGLCLAGGDKNLPPKDKEEMEDSELTDQEIDDHAKKMLDYYYSRHHARQFGADAEDMRNIKLPLALEKFETLVALARELKSSKLESSKLESSKHDRSPDRYPSAEELRNRYREYDNGEGPLSIRNPQGFQLLHEYWKEVDSRRAYWDQLRRKVEIGLILLLSCVVADKYLF